METAQFDVAVIGGGAVGLACALECAQRGRSVVVLEKNERFAAETSARNSEVVHAGFYYSPGSNKEKFCLEGRELLYSFCEKNKVPFRKCQKLVVAADSGGEGELNRLLENARRNQVPVQMLLSREMEELEPALRAHAGFLSSESGIFCSETFALRLQSRIESFDGFLINRSDVISTEKNGDRYRLTVSQPSGICSIETQHVINAAGLHALKMGDPVFNGAPPFSLKYVRGHYMALSEKYRNITSRLIYPLPDKKGGGLGIHLTLDLQGNARLGPDTDWRFENEIQYSFFEADEETLRQKFFEVARTYLKRLEPEHISPGFVGIRPKLVSPEGKMLDFYIQEESSRGYPNWINLLGIESPGLTASLAIARHVSQWV